MLWAFRLLFGFEKVSLRAPRAAAIMEELRLQSKTLLLGVLLHETPAGRRALYAKPLRRLRAAKLCAGLGAPVQVRSVASSSASSILQRGSCLSVLYFRCLGSVPNSAAF